jgi:hypothetical protein
MAQSHHHENPFQRFLQDYGSSDEKQCHDHEKTSLIPLTKESGKLVGQRGLKHPPDSQNAFAIASL